MLDKTTQDWKSLAAGLEIEGRAFINGQYENSLSGETRATMSPGNGEKLADVANCGTEDADNAVVVARATFESGVWGVDGARRSEDGACSLGGTDRRPFRRNRAA